MSRTLLAYVSGHGFGHARRLAQSLRALLKIRPEIQIHVRTSAPASIFTRVGVPAKNISSSSLDSGMVEASVLDLDAAATIRHVAALLETSREIVAEEVRFAETIKPDLLISELPFLAGDIAEELRVPCIGHGNFTWDWIYEPLCQHDPATRDIPARIRESYAKMECVLRLPISHPMPMFRRVIDTPLVATLPSLPKAAVLARIGVAPNDRRPRVLAGMRGGTDNSALFRAAEQSPEMLFITPQEIPAKSPENIRSIRLGADLDFSDVLGACDVTLSKLGYGTLADSIAVQTALLWPARSNFREDRVSEEVCPRWLRMHELPVSDFFSGNWGPHLRQLLSSPPPPERIEPNGAEFCGEWLSKRLRC